MRKLIIVLAMLLAASGVSAQDYTRNGKTFTQVKSAKSRQKSESTPTAYTWEDSKGNKHPIFLSANGSAFVNKKSAKTGKEYRHYLGEQMSREICKEMGVKYKGKKSAK